MKNKPLYNSKIIKIYLQLIKNKYSYVDIYEILNYAGIEPYQVDDEGHWFTQEQIDRFYEKLVKLTGNPNIAREAGRYAASPDALGLIRQYILSLVGPAKVYEFIGEYANKFTRSSHYKSKKIKRNRVEITVTPFKGIEEKIFQCENRMGFWEAIALLFNYRLPKIEHPECMFHGGNVCRYIISWEESLSARLNRLVVYLALLFLVLNIIFFIFYPEISLFALPLSAILILTLTNVSASIKNKELEASLKNFQDASEEVLENIQINYDQAFLINEIGQVLSKQTKIENILSETIQILQNRLDYDRGIILLANEDKTKLIPQTGFGYDFEQYEYIKNTNFHLDKPESKGPFIVAFREQKPILVNDLDEIALNLSPRSLQFAKKLGTKSFICCPIVYNEESLGILAVDNVKSKRPLLQRDINLLMGIATEIGISINNAKLFEIKEKQFQSTLKVLAESIDARDNLTRGHSERVAEYAKGIAKELGMSDDFIEMIYVAGLLHDYGKIGIPDSILKKEGPLTNYEYEEIKSHVDKTQKIIEQIEFDKKYQGIVEVITYHHEKIDGSGYPKGLTGDQIPIGAKILAVADFFDAITSHRHYRNALPLDEAFSLLIEKRGVHYDEEIVDSFIRFYKKTYSVNLPSINVKQTSGLYIK